MASLDSRADYQSYLSCVVDPDATFRVPHSYFFTPGRPAHPVEGRGALHGHTGGWYLVRKPNQMRTLRLHLLNNAVFKTGT